MHDSQTEPFDLSPFAADVPVRTPRPDWYEPPNEVQTPALRLLPKIGDTEPLWKRWLFALIAVAICGGYLYFVLSYWAPGPGRLGVDENAYLVGGRNFADHWSTGFKPPNDYAYVGLMWVQSPKNGWYYPKYPMGQSVLYGIALKLGGAKHGVDFALLVNPICTALSLLAIFFLVRAIAGSFWGVLSMFALGFGYTTLERVNNPDSHASALFFVTAGMCLLLRWWQTGSAWRGIVGGLLLGAAATIRYNEAALVFPVFALDRFLSHTKWFPATEPHGGPLHWLWILVKCVRFLPIGPIAIAAVCALRWRRLRSYVHVALPLIAWTIPVSAMLLFNFKTLGAMSGYDLTHESEGFSPNDFLDKWQFTVAQLLRFGLFLTFPLGIVGLVAMFRRSARTACYFLLWFLPGALLYVAYYWGNHTPGVAFMRFYLTLFPPMIAAAMWFIYSAGPAKADRARGSIAIPMAAGILTASIAGVGAMICMPDLNIEQRHNLNIAYTAEQFSHALHRTNPKAAKPIVFCDEGMLPHLLQFMQFRTDGEWYPVNAFDEGPLGVFGLMVVAQPNADKKDGTPLPVLIQQSRIDAAKKLDQGMTDAQRLAAERDLIKSAMTGGRPVYAILTPWQVSYWKKRATADNLEAKEITWWKEPCNIPNDENNGPLAPNGWGGDGALNLIHRSPQELHLLQLFYKQKS